MQRADEGAGASLGTAMTTVRGKGEDESQPANHRGEVLLLPEFELASSAEHAKQNIPV